VGGDEKTSSLLPPLMASVSFGTQLWEQLCKLKKSKTPQDFSHFQARSGQLGPMPATGGDILLHVKAETKSLAWETVKAFVDSLPKGSVQSIDDQYGFQFQEGRDLSGFLDGTENPSGLDERKAAALLPTGGSYIIHQRWLHNLPKLHALPEAQQENVIGRSKADSAEFSAAEMPKNSHVAKTRDAKGNKIPIVRQSMPFGRVGGDHGLLFIAYANKPGKFDTMLDQMVGKLGGPEGDAIMAFSSCIASQYYYCPSLKELASL